jgi:hypothetical protein
MDETEALTVCLFGADVLYVAVMLLADPGSRGLFAQGLGCERPVD